MLKEIKCWVLIWVTFLITVITWWLVYAWIVWTVTSGQTLTADMWNDMAGNYDYSTDEVNTWKKWVDGKTIYRKVVQLPTITTDSNRHYQVWYVNPASDIETLIHIEMLSLTWGDRTARENSSYTFDYRLSKYTFWYIMDSTFASQYDWAYIVQEYTKTTD